MGRKSKGMKKNKQRANWQDAFSGLSLEQKTYVVSGAIFVVTLVVSSAQIAFDRHFLAGFMWNILASPVWGAGIQLFVPLWAAIHFTHKIKDTRRRRAIGMLGGICLFLLLGSIINMDAGNLDIYHKKQMDKVCNYSATAAACRDALQNYFSSKSYACEISGKDGSASCSVTGDKIGSGEPSACGVDKDAAKCAHAFNNYLSFKNLKQNRH